MTLWVNSGSAEQPGHQNATPVIFWTNWWGVKNQESQINLLPKNEEGQTPLHCAAGNGHRDICKMIVQHIKDKEPKDKFK